MSELPIVIELSPPPTIADAFSVFEKSQNVILFDSARSHPKLGRYSFLSANPLELFVVEQPKYGLDPFAEIKTRWSSLSVETIPDLPPFQGGFAGILSYELGQCWEKLPKASSPGDDLPSAVIGMYDWVLSWDHDQNRCWLIVQGDSRVEPKLRWTGAEEKSRRLHDQFLEAVVTQDALHGTIAQSLELKSNFERAEYLEAVARVVEYIWEGDIFQANLSQRLTTQTSHSPLEVYLSLRQHNPAPFAGFFRHEDWAILSSSPERFLQKSGDQLWTRPIKGTRQRQANPEADLFTRDELRESLKDQSENVMIVDLLRNDLSRVCRPGTIRVPELCSIETYETVTHLVSEVTGELQKGSTFWDAIAATFPGGSITGAPKIRAMEIITELEQVARGAYCGSMFYCGFDGTADSNILIRTITQRGTQLSFSVGGGIVAQSSPEVEYEETLHKAAGIKMALSKMIDESEP